MDCDYVDSDNGKRIVVGKNFPLPFVDYEIVQPVVKTFRDHTDREEFLSKKYLLEDPTIEQQETGQ